MRIGSEEGAGLSETSSRYRSSILLGLLALLAYGVFAQDQPAAPPNLRPTRALALQRYHHRLRAGQRVSILAPQETADFVLGAKGRVVTINGSQGKGFAFEPNP